MFHHQPMFNNWMMLQIIVLHGGPPETHWVPQTESKYIFDPGFVIRTLENPQFDPSLVFYFKNEPRTHPLPQ